MKDSGQLRYVGITTSHGRRHRDLEQVMRDWPIDFVQATYNVVDREVEQRILPLAAERGIAFIANRPYRRGALIDRVKREPLPAWAAECDCRDWAGLLLKFIAHPAVTCAIPATSGSTTCSRTCARCMVGSPIRRCDNAWWHSSRACDGRLGGLRAADFLMFTPATYVRQYALLNASLWPLHVVMLAAAIAAAWLARPGRAVAGGTAAGGGGWRRPGGFYQRYAPISLVGGPFSGLFVLRCCWSRSRGSVSPAPARARWPGWLLCGYALVGHPLLGVVAGRDITALEWFTLPRSDRTGDARSAVDAASCRRAAHAGAAGLDPVQRPESPGDGSPSRAGGAAARDRRAGGALADVAHGAGRTPGLNSAADRPRSCAYCDGRPIVRRTSRFAPPFGARTRLCPRTGQRTAEDTETQKLLKRTHAVKIVNTPLDVGIAAKPVLMTLFESREIPANGRAMGPLGGLDLTGYGEYRLTLHFVGEKGAPFTIQEIFGPAGSVDQVKFEIGSGQIGPDGVLNYRARFDVYGPKNVFIQITNGGETPFRVDGTLYAVR